MCAVPFNMPMRHGLVVVFLLMLNVARVVQAQTGNPGGAINDRLGNPDYGVCRGVDPRCYHAWPRTASDGYKVLLFTRTAGPRHGNLGPALAAGLNPPLSDANVVQREMQKLAQSMQVQLDYTEDVAQMTRLSGYHAVIFFSTSREALDDNAKTALRQYLRAGGSFVGIHNAFGTLYNWPYYEGLLGNANFYDHGPYREADVVMVNRKDASTSALPPRWRFKDEWYNLVPFPTNVRFLATVDESTYGPGQAFAGPPPGVTPPARVVPVVGAHPGHGRFHPVAWCQYYDGGKVWVTTLGHDANIFVNDNQQFPGSEQFHQLLVGALQSVLGIKPFCQ